MREVIEGENWTEEKEGEDVNNKKTEKSRERNSVLNS